MRYREFRPQPPLNGFVECFWTLDGESTARPVQPERILPDGCVELILNFGSNFVQHIDNRSVIQPRHFLVGQMTGPILISPTGLTDLIGIRFHPGGTLPFFRIPLHEITDQIIDLGSLSSNWKHKLLNQGLSLLSMSQRVEILEARLRNYIHEYKHNPCIRALAGEIVRSAGLASIEQLANEAGISIRQLERRFLIEVGIGPKLMSRILRFQQVFRAVDYCAGAWAPIAVECGYYDQAHLIRDFNQFAHQTPAVLLAQKTELTQAFTRKMRMSDFSNTQR